MNDRIHHRCRCLGKDFTFQEWVDYCKDPAHDSAQIVMTYEEFGFNVNDVCMTPRVPVKLIVAPHYYLAVKTAQSPCGKWDAGFDYGLGTGGGSSPCAFTDGKTGYDNERIAVFSVLARCRESFAKRLDERSVEDDDSRKANTRKLLALIDDALERWDPRQLTLF